MPTDPSAAPRRLAPATGRLRRHRRGLLLAGALGIPALVFVLWWFQPQALLFDDVVDEEFPAATPAEADDEPAEDPIADEVTDDGLVDAATGDEDTGDEDTAGETPATPAGPVELAAGSFESRNRYTVTGTATAFELEDGQRVLRLEDFESTNGPDLFVYLTAAGTADDDADLDADFVDLGALTGNIGDQNYVIPDDVDLDRYTSVTIWCRRFTTSFGVADLTLA